MYTYYADQISSDPDDIAPGYVSPSGVGDNYIQKIIGRFDWGPFPYPGQDESTGTGLPVSAIAPGDVFVFAALNTQWRYIHGSIIGSSTSANPLKDPAGGGWTPVSTPATFNGTVGVYERAANGDLGPVIDDNFFRVDGTFINVSGGIGPSQYWRGARFADRLIFRELYDPDVPTWFYICGTVTAVSGLTHGGQISVALRVKNI